MVKGPPTPDEVFSNLMRILRPPLPPWLIQKFIEEREEQLEELGAPWEIRKRRGPASTGSRMAWPYRITWRESPSGRGQIRVLKEERIIGSVSYLSKESRMSLVNLLESIIKGGG